MRERETHRKRERERQKEIGSERDSDNVKNDGNRAEKVQKKKRAS